MKKLLSYILLLLIISPVFAEDYMFTNEDLILYSDEFLHSKKNADSYEEGKENPSISEQGTLIKQETDSPTNRQEGLSKNLAGEICDVLNFSSRKINYAVHNPDYRISGTITKQTVTVHIKSKGQMPLMVENFYIVASLEDGTKQIKQLQPASGDSLRSLIQPDSEYTGYALFEGDLAIISLGCHITK